MSASDGAKQLVRRLNAADANFASALAQLTRFEQTADAELSGSVTKILADVREQGDPAVLAYTNRFDRQALESAAALSIDAADLKAARDQLPAATHDALVQAADRIEQFHRRQLSSDWDYRDADGTRLGQQVTPLDSVGLYVPGGKAAYPSSLLMNAIPAKVAGVSRIQMVVPTPDGVRNQAVLAAAAIAGVDNVYCIGGAQAIGALAFGTQTIAPVDKIVGPGNAWVAEAKRQVFGTVGIDMIAGPSEILVLTDGSAPPDWIAMDLFSQAEHDEMAQAILLCPDASYINEVEASIQRLIQTMPRRDVIEQSLQDRGALIQVADMDQACEISNQIAPEHLELIVKDSSQWAKKIRHAGAIFIGPYACESMGDYCAGPNHVLPTMRTARFSSPLGVYDFQKRSSIIEVSRASAGRLGPLAATLADAEGLTAHAVSARMRADQTQKFDPYPVTVGERAIQAPDALAFAFGEQVRNMHGYQVADATGFIKLDAMESPYRLPDHLREAFGRRLADVAINRYPQPDYRALKESIARNYQIPDGYPVVLGNGSDELISMLILAARESGRPILAPWPSFAMYKVTAELVGMRFVGVDLTEDFQLAVQATLDAVAAQQPALVFIAYPNNPTGACFDEQGIEQIIRAAPGLVVLDEAYFPFAGQTWMSRLAEFDNLIVMRTVSKLGLAGLRLGYLCAAPAITEQLEKVRPPYNISVLNEAAALFALEHQSVLDGQTDQIKAQRPELARALAAIDRVQVYESQTNFLLTKVPQANRVDEGLKRRKVLVRNVGSMHPSLVDCLRITVSTEAENQQLIDALQQSVAEL